MMRTVLVIGFIVAVIMLGEWLRAVETVRGWQEQEQSLAAGPGPCRFIGPESGQCQCVIFVRSDGYDGMCGTCSHPRWVHAGD